MWENGNSDFLSYPQGLEGFEIDDLDWIDGRKKVKAVTILIYETSV